jgi:hypothetical protein
MWHFLQVILNLTLFLPMILPRRHDTQHNDIQHTNTQHNETQHNDIRHKDTQHNVTQHNGLIFDN